LGCNLQVLELENILEPGISLSFLGGKGSCKFNMRLRGFFITVIIFLADLHSSKCLITWIISERLSPSLSMHHNTVKTA